MLDISPAPTTREDSSSELMGSFLFVPPTSLLNWDFARNNEFTFEIRYGCKTGEKRDGNLPVLTLLQLFLDYQAILFEYYPQFLF